MLTCVEHVREPRELPVGARALFVTPLLLLALSASVQADPLFGARTDFATGLGPNSVALADINSDGRPDLAMTNFYSNMVSVMLGNGDGTFGTRFDYPTISGPQGAAFGDLNADGWPDLVIAEQGASFISVLLGSGDGTFRGWLRNPTSQGPISVAIADLNADGSMDLVVAYPLGGVIKVLLGNGTGFFLTGSFYGTEHSPYSVAIADFNADGWLDLAAACNSGSTVTAWFGTGDGTFQGRTDYFTGIQCTSVGSADFNADGQSDLAVVNYRSNTVTLLMGGEPGGFGAQYDFDTGSFPLRLAIGDLDLDGRPDLAVVNSGSNTVSTLLGNGDGTLAPKVDFGTGEVPVAVATADLNADCRPDLVVANYGSNTVSVLLNASPLPQVAVTFDFTPGALNLAAQGLWVTGYIEPVAPVTAADIDVASIRLNGTVPVDPAAPTVLGDYDGDGITDLMVKFNRLAVELTLPEGDHVPITFTSAAPCRTLIGTDYIRVRHVVVSAPVAGSHLGAGSVAQVSWQTPDWVTVQSVALLYSLDGGTTWSQITHGQPNAGSYAWTVPAVQTDQAKVAVVLVESADETGELVEGVLGVSEAFAIETVVGVGDGGAAPLALSVRGSNRGVAADGRLWVEFSLRDGSPARLEVVDVAGRVMASRQVGTLGPGTHALDVAEGAALRAGIYFLRLTQGGSDVRARATVLR